MENIKKFLLIFITVTSVFLLPTVTEAQSNKKDEELLKDIDALDKQVDKQLLEKDEETPKIVTTTPTPAIAPQPTLTVPTTPETTSTAAPTVNPPGSNVPAPTTTTPNELAVPKGFEDQFDSFNITDTKDVLQKSKEERAFTLQDGKDTKATQKPDQLFTVTNPTVLPKPTTIKTEPKPTDVNSTSGMQLPPISKDEIFSPYIYDRNVYDYRNKVLSPQISKEVYGPNNEHLPRVFYEKEYSQYLFIATINDDINAIRSFLERGADINAQDAKNGYTPLMYSVQNNKQKSYNYLISKGANLNIQSNDGKTALHIATMLGNLDAMESLLNQGANSTIKDSSGKVPYLYAAGYSSEFALLAVKKYQDMNKALIDYTQLEVIPSIKYALKNGANINYQDENGDTALIIATKKGNFEIVNLLLSEGANPFIRNLQGLAALDISAMNNDQKLKDSLKTIIAMNELEGRTDNPYAQYHCEDYLGYDLNLYPSIKFLEVPATSKSLPTTAISTTAATPTSSSTSYPNQDTTKDLSQLNSSTKVEEVQDDHTLSLTPDEQYNPTKPTYLLPN